MKYRATALSLVVACGLGLSASTVSAQDRVMVTATAGEFIGPGGGGQGRITKGSVETFAKLLNLTADQKSAAMALHEGYDAEYSKAQKDFSSAMEEMRRAAEESDDRSVFMERMPKAREELTKKTKALEKSFMGDLQALITTEQQGSWAKVERQRRRDVMLRPGSVSGEGVNLLETVDGLKLSDEVKTTLAEPLNSYEGDMDRALRDKQKMLDDQPAFEPGRGFDMEAFQARMKQSREAGLKVREVNQTYQRRIESSLPEDKRPAFNEAVRKATFPQVYRQSRIARQMEAAAKFDDLNDSQKDSLSTLKASYERDAAAANNKWADEIEAAEKKGDSGGDLAIAGGGRMSVRFGEEDDNSPLAQARKARRELDDKVRTRLDSILNKDQKERLPKEQGQREGGQFIMDTGVVVR